MFKFRVSKYDPKFRDENGCYVKNEWTSFSDINKDFDGVKFLEKDYLKIEKRYINFIFDLLNILKINTVKISKQEPKKLFAKKKFNVQDGWFLIIVQEMLREKFWAKISAIDLEIYMGYDFYLHIDILDKNIYKLLEKLAKDNKLFLEELN